MAKLGVPASTVINMLYKQIIMTRSIPFSLSVPDVPIARDEMDTAAFDAMMSEGLAQAKAGQGLPLEEVSWQTFLNGINSFTDNFSEHGRNAEIPTVRDDL